MGTFTDPKSTHVSDVHEVAHDEDQIDCSRVNDVSFSFKNIEGNEKNDEQIGSLHFDDEGLLNRNDLTVLNSSTFQECHTVSRVTVIANEECRFDLTPLVGRTSKFLSQCSEWLNQGANVIFSKIVMFLCTCCCITSSRVKMFDRRCRSLERGIGRALHECKTGFVMAADKTSLRPNGPLKYYTALGRP